MGDFVREHGLGFIAAHAAQQAGGDRHQRIVAAGAGGKGVDLWSLVDRHLGHLDAGGLGLALDRGDQPGLGLVARLLDHHRAGAALGHPLGRRQ